MNKAAEEEEGSQSERDLSWLVLLLTGSDLVPYLPQLMDFLLSAVTSAHSYHAKSLAISAIGAAGMQTTWFLLDLFIMLW